MQISACDVMRRLRLVKATASPQARGCHDAKRAGRCHSKKLERLASGRVEGLKGEQQSCRRHWV